jgi:hypothetical protein
MHTIGELHDDNSKILGHGHNHFSEILGLGFFFGFKFNLRDLGTSNNDLGNRLTEELTDFLRGDVTILYDVVKKTGHDGIKVHLELDESCSDIQGMNDVGLTRGALHSSVFFIRKLITLPKKIHIKVGNQHLGPVNELVDGEIRLMRKIDPFREH